MFLERTYVQFPSNFTFFLSKLMNLELPSHSQTQSLHCVGGEHWSPLRTVPSGQKQPGKHTPCITGQGSIWRKLLQLDSHLFLQLIVDRYRLCYFVG